jgi:predicted SAM-dependent methyltransferase
VTINGVHYLNYDLTYGLPLKDKSADCIYGSHFIEHLSFDEGIKFFHEAYIALKKNGTIRISCPDLEKYALKYVQKDGEFYHNKLKKFCYHPQAKTPGEIFIAKAYDGKLHRWFYDSESLHHLMRKAGFRNINKKRVHQSSIKDIEKVEPKFREVESLYIEATK